MRNVDVFNLFSRLCVGAGKSIWKYVIQHVYQQRLVLRYLPVLYFKVSVVWITTDFFCVLSQNSFTLL